jgi:hypothetical protein
LKLNAVPQFTLALADLGLNELMPIEDRRHDEADQGARTASRRPIAGAINQHTSKV